jgi:predicted nucleic acid-binding protein
VRLFVSDYILQELSDTLVEDLDQSRRYATLACQAVKRKAKLVELPPSVTRYVPGDPKDDPIVQTALSAKADYLVTADQQILKVGKVQGVRMITAVQFDQLLASSK